MVAPTLFEALQPIERDALTVLALEADYPQSRTHWQHRAEQAGLRDALDRKLQSPSFKEIVMVLVASGMVVEGPSGFTTRARWNTLVVADAQRRGRLAEIVRGLEAGNRSYGTSYIAPRMQLLSGLGLGDTVAVDRAVAGLRMRVPRAETLAILPQILGMDVPAAWLATFSGSARTEYLSAALELALLVPQRIGPALEEAVLASRSDVLHAQLAMLLALRGEPERALGMVGPDAENTAWIRGAHAFIELTTRRLSSARSIMQLAAIGPRGQRVEPPGVLGLFDLLLAVTSDDGAEVADVPRRLGKSKNALGSFPFATAAIEGLALFRKAGQRPHAPAAVSGSWLDLLVPALAAAWTGAKENLQTPLAQAALFARNDGFTWLADELDRIRTVNRAGSLLALWGTKETWELALDSLGAALGTDDAQRVAAAGKGKRDAELWWTVEANPESGWIAIEAHLVGRAGTKGTKVSMRRLLDPNGDVGTEQDRRVALAMDQRRDTAFAPPLSVLVPLAGHPRVRDARGRSLTLELREPALHVEPSSPGVLVRLVPGSFDESGTAIARDGDTKILVYRRTPLATAILASLPPGGLRVPEAGLPRLSAILGAGAAGIAVEAAGVAAGESRPGDARIHVQMFRAGGALRARLRVVPGCDAGPALRPGVPPSQTMISGAHGLVTIVRDLADERARADRLLERCPVLASLPVQGADSVTQDLETSLELLVELQEAASDPALDIVVAWPEGQAMKPPVVRSASDMKMRVKGNGAWLTVEGDVRVDESRVVAMRELVANASRAQGRFVPIGEDEYIAMTGALRKKLDAIGRMQRLSKDGRIPGAMLSGMEAIWEGVDIQFADAVKKRRDALESARTLAVKLPRGLEAELRDYQRDGFVFLARRAEAGLGACLADDMGLGKTVQAIALLLHRRKKGPSLVVAPTSVRRNWETEIHRFAPSLTITRFGDGDRAEQIASAKTGDVVLVSYGLLAAAQEVLASREWGTIVLDEAHALKNASTHRWSAARALKSEAIVALTGTPVENHAGELHALFDLLLPGMLGVRSTFDRALGSAIADGDRDAAALLRQMVRPFVLRRTKSEVLTELPPKTELVQVVPASPAHRAYYEAIRRTALEKIDAARKAGGARAARARIDVLAEITRLRRAAIDPRLVGGDDAPPGGKIDALLELVTELKAEGRRALVFSQYLEALDLARTSLEGGGIECLRLDGSMSESARATEVSAFQSGRGDVFLVSLKAGGVGMNLTAADFVVFLDPWWNPAVEDQATGRAHRMGQERPVTVARLVTEGTIEEKVLALHDRKRKLYEDIVSEADGSGTLSVEAIGELLGG